MSVDQSELVTALTLADRFVIKEPYTSVYPAVGLVVPVLVDPPLVPSDENVLLI